MTFEIWIVDIWNMNVLIYKITNGWDVEYKHANTWKVSLLRSGNSICWYLKHTWDINSWYPNSTQKINRISIGYQQGITMLISTFFCSVYIKKSAYVLLIHGPFWSFFFTFFFYIPFHTLIAIELFLHAFILNAHDLLYQRSSLL